MRTIRPSFKRRRGFTLMEVALATTIVGSGFVAMLALLAAGTRVTHEGAEQTSASLLTRGMKEYTLSRTFAQVRAMNNQTYTPPIDSCGAAISTLPNWSQRVTVQPVDPDRVSLNIASADPDAVRVTVKILRNGESVAEEQWYAYKPLR
jgi:prepilin-type N-terminal cleavage/methylation domain-containing protein